MDVTESQSYDPGEWERIEEWEGIGFKILALFQNASGIWVTRTYNPIRFLVTSVSSFVKVWIISVIGTFHQGSPHCLRQWMLKCHMTERENIPTPIPRELTCSRHHVQFSRSVVSNSLWPHGLQHARLPCPSPTPGACSNSCHQVGDAIQPSHPLSSPFLLPSIFPSIRVFSPNESVLHIS